MKILILYATHFGQTRAIARKLAERLRDHAIDADVMDARYDVPSPEGYDLVVIGSRIELGRHASPIIAYIREHREALEGMPTAFFSVSMAAAQRDIGQDPNGYLASTFDAIGWKPTRAIAFAGALPYREYNWFLRFIMKRISKAAGHTVDTSKNHEFTDWSAVQAFADEIAGLVPARAAIL